MDTKTLAPNVNDTESDEDNLPLETCTKIHYGANIRAIRKALGLSQENLAVEIGLTQKKISLLENSSSVDEKTLQSIAEVFGVTVGFIEKYNPALPNNNIQNNYGPAGGFDVENAEVGTITNSLVVIKFMAQSLTEAYQQTIDELKKRLDEYRKGDRTR